MKTSLQAKCVLLAATAIGLASPALAQNADDRGSTGNDIIVTAQRVEQRLQDVPVSVTVLNDKMLANNNITSAKDIATYSPTLTVNSRYGSDNTTWTIRGFTQEQRTTPTVGTYFADVVAPRGSGGTQGGDGAGPGNLFDLQNVQVLNGPQGTLFGRNSTGGAVLLVPRRPTDRLEGYLEGSLGDYNLRRIEGVLNIPVSDKLRVRLGVDSNKRDGYLKNVGLVGEGPYGKGMGSVDYLALRASVVADLTPDIENYTVATYSNSRSTGVIPQIYSCFSLSFCTLRDYINKAGTFAVANPIPYAGTKTQQWQVIDTLKWQVSDNLTVKNIFSYGEHRDDLSTDLFGVYLTGNPASPAVPPTLGTESGWQQVRPFNSTNPVSNGHTNSESSLVEELQLSGHALDGKLTFQTGAYLESNKPIGLSGTFTAGGTPCLTITPLNCVGNQYGSGVSSGSLTWTDLRTWYNDKALYFQSSYDLTNKLKLTGGVRYTWDEVRSTFHIMNVGLQRTLAAGKYYNNVLLTAPTVVDYTVCTNIPTFGAQGSSTNSYMPLANLMNGMCAQTKRAKSSAPTWLINLDYKPIDDVMVYAKWARGYRQANVNAPGADNLQVSRPEHVDTYEVGLKSNWHGPVPGYFNFAGFYNNFRDQQVQVGVQCAAGSTTCVGLTQTTAILNVGKSRLSGFEAELGIEPIQGLQLSASWAHLRTRIQQVLGTADRTTAKTLVTQLVANSGLPYDDVRPPLPGDVLPNSVPDKVVGNASFTLPTPESIGKITLSGSWVWQSAFQVVADNSQLLTVPTLYHNSTTPTATAMTYSTVGGGKLPAQNFGNVNVSWENFLGQPVDFSVFVTNVTNKKIYLHSNVQENFGFTSRIIGEPRMFGFRMKYRFGA